MSDSQQSTNMIEHSDGCDYKRDERGTFLYRFRDTDAEWVILPLHQVPPIVRNQLARL